MSMTDEQIEKLYNKHFRMASASSRTEGNGVKAVVVKPEPDIPAPANVARLYREQLVGAGYSPEQADACEDLLSAHARRMAPMFGRTPEEFLRGRLAGFAEMSPEDFAGMYQPETSRRRNYVYRGSHSSESPDILYQLDRNGNAVAPGESNPKIASVVPIDPSVIPVDWKDTKKLTQWVRERLQGITVEINDDGTIVRFSRNNLDASTKRRGEEQRGMYSDLGAILENSLFDRFEEADERHQNLSGQNVYYAAARIGSRHFAVRFKVDMPLNESGMPTYKDHKVKEIEIAPSLYPAHTQKRGSRQDESAIRGISLSVLKGDVKPSRIENGTLFQFAGKNSHMSEPVRANLDKAQELAATGTDNEAIRQQTGWFRGMDGKWRYEIPDDFKDINFSLLSQRPGARIPLPEIYNNPALYEAYPFLREISVRDMHDDEYGQAFFNPIEGKGVLVVDRETYTEPLETPNPFISLIHEIQHAIQDREGFARGGYPDFASLHPDQDAKRIELNKILTDMAKSGKFGTDEYKKLEDERDSIIKKSWEFDKPRSEIALEEYNRLAGEIEACDSSARADLSDSERAATAPRLQEDAIVIFDDAPVATFSLDRQKNRGARGAIRQLDDGRWLVGLFRNRDASTIIHETGHFFLENFREAADLGSSPQWVGESWAALQKAYGFEGHPTGKEWTRVQERFATDFEAYLREGKAPSHELRPVFEKFRDWLTDIYRSVRELLGEEGPSPEVREVFDRLLASEKRIIPPSPEKTATRPARDGGGRGR